MNLQRNFKNALFVIILLYVSICFLSISLLERALPNVPMELRTALKIEQSLQKLTRSFITWDQTTASQRTAIGLAELESLRSLVQSEEAKARLNALEQLIPQASEGDSAARTQAMEIVQAFSLAQLHEAEDLSERIKRTTLASAWTLVLIGLFGLSVTSILMFRFKKRVLDPFSDLLQLFDDWKHGNRHRRFNTHVLEKDLRDKLETLNEVLDQSQSVRPTRPRL